MNGERANRACTGTMMVVLALVAGCSSSSTSTGSGGPPGSDGGIGNGDAAAANPCGANGVFGTFKIKGTLNGTETICGLSLGSFDAGTLTITEAAGGATVTVANSGSGHIDVASCAATVTACKVSASKCAGATDKGASVSLDMTVTSSTLSGSSQLGFNGCQAPGLSFTGTR